MYRTVVKRKVSATFAALSEGNHDALLDQLADGFRYRFLGDNALAGTRSQRQSMTEWFDRVAELFPGLQFACESTNVSGPPWATTVLTHVQISAPSGYSNELFQKIRLRWGKITEITTLEDLDRLGSELRRLEEAGVSSAGATPIIDA